MDKLDLRQIGTLFGHKLFVDVSDLPYHKDKNDILSNRDHAEIEVTKTLQEFFNPKPEPSELEKSLKAGK